MSNISTENAAQYEFKILPPEDNINFDTYRENSAVDPTKLAPYESTDELGNADAVKGNVPDNLTYLNQSEKSYMDNYFVQKKLQDLTMEYQLKVEILRTFASMVEDLVDTNTEARKDVEESVA